MCIPAPNRSSDGTRLLTVGSTGATGLGSFVVDDNLAYQAQLLHFVDGELRVLDYLSLQGISGNYTIQRTVIEPDEARTESEDTE